MNGADLLAHQSLRALPGCRVLVRKKLRHVVERLGHVLDAEVGDADERDAVASPSSCLARCGHRAGALDDVECGAVAAADVVHAAVAGDGGHDLHAHASRSSRG